jgi:hypothetical protein
MNRFGSRLGFTILAVLQAQTNAAGRGMESTAAFEALDLQVELMAISGAEGRRYYPTFEVHRLRQVNPLGSEPADVIRRETKFKEPRRGGASPHEAGQGKEEGKHAQLSPQRDQPSEQAHGTSEP